MFKSLSWKEGKSTGLKPRITGPKLVNMRQSRLHKEESQKFESIKKQIQYEQEKDWIVMVDEHPFP